MSLNSLSLKIAQSQNGVQEVPKNSNAGPAVESYLKSVGLGKGYAWCMAFVYWSVKEASKQLNTETPLIKTAGVLRQWNEITPKMKVTKSPKSGDIFIMDYGKGQGHTGFVVEVRADGSLKTIEGNTNDEGSREGYEVAYRIRKQSAIKGYIRIAN
ncbi:CHAP domain-containing protein [Chryseobacterium mulctrae]|uniref:CHAP domain-containing protein n=1 Tax=Chryseobacterium mulctrae TaxID=2576777 RepID=UPI001116E3DF|nr:CHAP domain-containing protein [Chryseobacterium mulctrae]